MTHQELINTTISVHIAVLIGAIAMWYKYGDRTEVLAKSLEGIEKVFHKLRSKISEELSQVIKTTFSMDLADPHLTIDLDDERFVYTERIHNIVASEKFRQAIRNHIESKADSFSDYRILIRARDIWCFWVKILSWTILLLIICQIISIALHGLVNKVIGLAIPDFFCYFSLSFTGFIILLMFLVFFPIILWNHNLIIKQKVKYEKF